MNLNLATISAAILIAMATVFWSHFPLQHVAPVPSAFSWKTVKSAPAPETGQPFEWLIAQDEVEPLTHRESHVLFNRRWRVSRTRTLEYAGNAAHGGSHLRAIVAGYAEPEAALATFNDDGLLFTQSDGRRELFPLDYESIHFSRHLAILTGRSFAYQLENQVWLVCILERRDGRGR